MPTIEFTDELADEYNRLFAQATIRPEHDFEVNAVAAKVFNSQHLGQYQQVEAATGVPAHVVGIIHSLEASFDFTAHLHNGDPLAARTVHVPAGRPQAGEPPFSWIESAIDALTMHRLGEWTDWSVAGIAFVLERYNGFGYRLHHPQVKSPYLWSFTTIYSSGRYIADGLFSDAQVSRQCGGMAVLKRLIESGKITLTAPAAPADGGGVAVTPFLPGGSEPPPAAAAPPYPGHLIKMNSRGPDVIALQTRLRDLGISPGGIDGDFGDATKTAVQVFQARTVDPAGNPLEVDGIVGQNTWAALFGVAVPPSPAARPAAGSLLDEVLQVAAGEVGVREVPLGSNRGPRVDQYLNAVGPGLLGQPWCMAFVYFCFEEAAAARGVANPAPRTAGVKRSWQLAPEVPGARIVSADDAADDPSLVVPGMVFYIDTGGATGHAGFVADVVGATLVTVEGNTNDGGGREGIGVFHRTRRKIRDISLGFVAFA